MKKKMSLDDHLATATDLNLVFLHLKSVHTRCQGCYPKSYSVMQRLSNVLKRHGPLDKIKHELSSSYVKDVTLEEFKEFGNIHH